MKQRLTWASLAVLMAGLAACGPAAPPPVEYVLGPRPTAAATTALVQTGLPIVEVKRVLVPGYLDTTDILARNGSQVFPSRTGRWAERLSVGMTRALTSSLDSRLQGLVVTTTPPIQQPTWRILVDVASFEATADRHVVLTARWTITDGTGRQTLVVEQAALVEPIAGLGDAAVVAAMSRAIEDLAGRVAAGIERDVGAK